MQTWRIIIWRETVSRWAGLTDGIARAGYRINKCPASVPINHDRNQASWHHRHTACSPIRAAPGRKPETKKKTANSESAAPILRLSVAAPRLGSPMDGVRHSCVARGPVSALPAPLVRTRQSRTFCMRRCSTSSRQSKPFTTQAWGRLADPVNNARGAHYLLLMLLCTATDWENAHMI